MIDTFVQTIDAGGPAQWVIFGLSVVLMTVGLWKIWHFLRLGAWKHRRLARVVAYWETGDTAQALAQLGDAQDVRTIMARTAISAILSPDMTTQAAREDCIRVAKAQLHDAKRGLRLIELIVAIAPLVGLLGTVLGMIGAFQALQDSGAAADPAALAGGIWEALLTTAAGMAVAIPASILLSWFDGIVNDLQMDMEDAATQLFIHSPKH